MMATNELYTSQISKANYERAFLHSHHQSIGLFRNLHLIKSEIQAIVEITIAKVIVKISNDAVNSVINRSTEGSNARSTDKQSLLMTTL